MTVINLIFYKASDTCVSCRYLSDVILIYQTANVFLFRRQ